jgi:hypothetical protein
MTGTNPHLDGVRIPVDSDGDGEPDWHESREHTLPAVAEAEYLEGGREPYRYRYQRSRLKDSTGGTKCYSFSIENISLVEPLADPEQAEAADDVGLNHIELYLVQHVEGLEDTAGLIRRATYTQKFIAPKTREPDRRSISVSKRDLELLR